MNNLDLKFNVYDQIGYLLVGAMGILVLYSDSVLLNSTFPKYDLSTLIIWITIAYFVGHFIQAMANIFIRESKEEFSDDEKKMLNIARDLFEVEYLSDSEVWSLCYMLGVAKDPTGQIKTFNAYYSLYRGWFIVFIMETLFLLGYIILAFNLKNLTFLILSGFTAFLFFLRMKRFYSYLRQKVFQIFMIIKKIDFSEEKNIHV